MRAWWLCCLLAGGLFLAGCSGDDSPSSRPAPSASTAPTVEASTVASDGTTVAGTVLKLGQRAVVRWHADPRHESLVALSVTDVKRGKVKDLRAFTLNRAARASSVYYVSVVVRNVGSGNLSGQRLTLYGEVSRGLVVQPVSFTPTFQGCDDKPLPSKFTKGAKTHVCMLLLAPNHGKISAIQWRGPARFAPISWRVR